MKCHEHEKCRLIALNYGAWEYVNCPWCDTPLNLLSGKRWCRECFVPFRLQQGHVHFAKSFPTTFAEKMAIAIEKTEKKFLYE